MINEYTLFPEQCSFEHPDLYFGSSSASGLGWGAGAALGAKLARPDSPVIAVVGDGAFMFSNPAAVHHASALARAAGPVRRHEQQPNGGRSSAAARAMYPDGRAARATSRLSSAWKASGIREICEAAGGYGERVEDPAALPGALERAMAVVKTEGGRRC